MQERSKTKAQLIEEVDRLNKRIRALESELEETHRAASLGKLTGGVAHDFNNVLQVIQGNVSLMLSDIDVLIEQQVRSGARMAEKLLGISSGKDEAHIVQNLSRRVREIADVFGRARKQVTLHLDLDDSVRCNFDRSSELEHVLLDLFLAAANKMQRGGQIFVRTTWIECSAGPAVRTCPDCEGCAVFLLSDRQSGVEDSILDDILRAEPGETDVNFEIVPAQRIVVQQGGCLGVLTSVERGATWFFRLPTKVIERNSETPTPPVEPGKPDRTQILVVDDERVVLDVGCRSLEHLGFDVLSANSGPRAVEIFQQKWQDIDLVILDVVMPEMNGREVFAELKKINPEVRVLLASGYLVDGEVESIVESGGCGFIKKPFTISTLKDKVNSLLKNRPQPAHDTPK